MTHSETMHSFRRAAADPRYPSQVAMDVAIDRMLAAVSAPTPAELAECRRLHPRVPESAEDRAFLERCEGVREFEGGVVEEVDDAD